LESMSEAFALLSKGGVDPAAFHALITDTLFAGPIYKLYGKLALDKTFEPAGFQLRLALKDVKLAEEAARDLDMRLPVCELAREHLAEAVQAGLGEKDWTAVSALIARKA